MIRIHSQLVSSRPADSLPHYDSAHRAMTLIELLIAVTIVSMLMAVSIPLIRYSLEQDKVREGSRQLNMVLAGARTRAIERGRPYGIWIQRTEQNPNASSEIYNCESAPPYIGDIVDARVALLDLLPTPTTDGVAETLYFDAGCSSFKNFVHVGDIIRFNRSGHYFQITYVNAGPPGPALPPMVSGEARFQKLFPESAPPGVTTIVPPPGITTGLLFEVLGPPKRLNNTPLQLTDGVAIDLRHSGVGAEGTQFVYSAGDADHVVIAFDATGGMSYLYFDSFAQDVDGPVHLLVGKLDQLVDVENTTDTPNPISYDSVTSATVSYDKNLADQASIWVTVGSRNGTVTTAENAWELRPLPPWSGSPPTPYFTNSLRRAREFAQAADAMGGR